MEGLGANERAGNGKCMEKRLVGSKREGRVGKVVEGSVWEVYGKGVVWELLYIGGGKRYLCCLYYSPLQYSAQDHPDT